jgi:hypothetical protein
MIVPAWLKGALILVITLMAGVMLGASYERRRGSTHSVSSMDTHHVIDHLERELALDSAQHRAIAAIFARHQRTIDSSWHAVQPHVHAALDSTLREVAAVLRPDQIAKYREMLHERHPNALRP